MIKVAMIGAGSVVFSKNLTGDILSFPEFKNATMCYMDIDAERLAVGAALCRKAAKAVGAKPKILTTMDRREALRGADFVINMVQVGGFDSTLVDFEIPRKYGLNFTIADTTGPGGVFRALRTFPMLSAMAREMDELCPDAILLQYSNPMSMNMQTVFRSSGIQAVGLCHSVQGTFDWMCRTIGEKSEDCNFSAGGINHMDWYLRFEKDGQDLYPRLREAMNDPKRFATNKVRFEMMRRTGYFVSESSEHMSEYVPYFIQHGRETIERFGVPIDEYLCRCEGSEAEFARMTKFSKSAKPLEVHRSHEYGSLIMHSKVTGTPRVIYGNVPNDSIITNLPPYAVVECPILVDRNGLQPMLVEDLPPQLAALCQPHTAIHECFIQACLTGDRDYIYQACMLDPHTASVLTLDQIWEMTDELLAAEPHRLPKINAKPTRVPMSGKTFGKAKPTELRDRWYNRGVENAQPVLAWSLIGPFTTACTRQHQGLSEVLPIEKDIEPDAGLCTCGTYKDGKTVRKFQKADVTRNGRVSLVETFGQHEDCLAYAVGTVESVHPRDAEFILGSDDGAKVWLNGKVVFEKEIGRSYMPSADKFSVHLNAGVNHLVVKIAQYTGDWCFSLGVSKANF